MFVHGSLHQIAVPQATDSLRLRVFLQEQYDVLMMLVQMVARPMDLNPPYRIVLK
jgi:hypothetical protein